MNQEKHMIKPGSLSMYISTEGGQLRLECGSDSIQQKLMVAESMIESIEEQLDKIIEKETTGTQDEASVFETFTDAIGDLKGRIDTLTSYMERIPEEIKTEWFEAPEME